MNISTNVRVPSMLAATAVTLTLVGCATAPRHDAQLDAARTSVAAAHGDPRVTGDARTELAKADVALKAVLRAFASGASETP